MYQTDTQNKSANSIERVRAQFNYSAPTVDIRTLSPTEAKSYYHQLKNDGKEIDKNLLHDLSNIIGKEYEDMLLEEHTGILQVITPNGSK